MVADTVRPASLCYPGFTLATAPRPPAAEAIRDALGFVRILYAARKTRESTLPVDSDPLVAVGRELASALTLADCDQGTLGHRAALERAGQALARLGDELSLADSAARAAKVARARVLGERLTVAGKAPPERR